MTKWLTLALAAVDIARRFNFELGNFFFTP
jgi:hypothetical protein